MSYTVKFREDAVKEWNRLDRAVQQQFAQKLKKLSENPHISSARLHNLNNCYKIKLRTSGFRLVYEVIDNILLITVISVGKRERSEVYEMARHRLKL